MSRRGITFSTLVAVLLLAVPALAQAQTHAEAVWNQLNRLYNQVNGEGYGSRNYIIGRMNNGASDSWTLTLPGGASYKLVGVCDNDCGDLDIRVTIGDELVAEDILDDDVPIVNFSSKTETRYNIKVTMATCRSEPCFWGLAVFYK